MIEEIIELPNKYTNKSREELNRIYREDVLVKNVHSLISSKMGVNQPQEIAKILETSIESVMEAVEILFGLKYIKNSDQGYVDATSQSIILNLDHLPLAERKQAQQERLYSLANDYGLVKRLKTFSDIFMSLTTDEETLYWYVEELEKLNMAMLEKSKTSKENLLLYSAMGLIVRDIKVGLKEVK